MSEPKPEYKIDQGVLDNALNEQMQGLHESLSQRKKPEEFTIDEYAKVNELSYNQAKVELRDALSKDIVTVRKFGVRCYYRFTE